MIECQYTSGRHAPAWHRVSDMTQFTWITNSWVHSNQWFLKKVIEATLWTQSLKRNATLLVHNPFGTKDMVCQYCMQFSFHTMQNRAEHESWPVGFPRFYFLIYTINTYPINSKQKNSFWKHFIGDIHCKWKYNLNPMFCDQSGQIKIVFASLMERPNQ